MASVPGVLDFIVPYILFNVQSATLAHPFWTSLCLPAPSMSNLPCFLISFGLPRDFPLLQRPIRHVYSSILDFCLPFHHFNVQSTTLTRPFWTFSCLFSASTSNPPRLPIPFGLPRDFPPLQRPICFATLSLLDFSIPSLRFNVQSAVLAPSVRLPSGP